MSGLSSREILLIGKTSCGQQGWTQDQFEAQVRAIVGDGETWVDGVVGTTKSFAAFAQDAAISIGPTDSGADEEWAALDNIDYDFLRLNFVFQGALPAAGGATSGFLALAPGGAADVVTLWRQFQRLDGLWPAGGSPFIVAAQCVVAADENGIFQFGWNATGFDAVTTGNMWLTAYS